MSENTELGIIPRSSRSTPSPLDALRGLLAGIPEDLTLPQLRALVAIASEPGLSMTDLADRIGAPQQTASRHAAVLLGRYQDPMGGCPRILVEQRVSQDDPRRRALFVTEEGATLLSNITKSAFGGATKLRNA